jgi:serine/threonine protein kinase
MSAHPVPATDLHVLPSRGAPELRADAGIAARFSDGGSDLARVIQASAPLPATRAIHLAMQVLDALREAHARGIVHRRLAPSDCLVVEQGGDLELVKVTNFGAGEPVSEVDPVVDSAAVRAALAYVAPEQLRDARAADARSDVYSVGTILYEMLTRHRPFEADDRNALVVKICAEPPVPLADLRPDLSPQLCAAVEHALVKNPAGRAGSAVELADALLAAPESRSSAPAVRSVVPSVVDPMAATISRAALPIVDAITPTETWTPARSPSPPPVIPPNPVPPHLVPHPDRWAIVIVVVVLVLVGWVIHAALRSSPPPPSLPSDAIDEPVQLPVEPVDPKPIVVPSDATESKSVVAKPMVPSKPPPKPSTKPSTSAPPPATTTIVVPPFVLPPIFAPPATSSTKPKIGG